MKELIILAAVEEEFQLILLQQSELEKRWDCKLSFETLGVGPINSAANSVRIEMESNPAAEFLMLGSCGRYSDKFPLMKPVSPTRHYFGNAEIAAGRGYIPEFAFEPFEIPPFPKIDVCVCLTTPNVTSNNEDSALLMKHYQCDMEHLESYSALKPLVQKGRIVREILIPVNNTGPESHPQFLENFSSGLSVLNEYIINLEVFPWHRK